MIIGKNLLYERIDFHQIAVDMVKAYKLKSLVYTEEVKPKHQKKIDMKLTVFREDLALPFRPKPDNDSPTTMRELKYLSKLENISISCAQRVYLFNYTEP